MFPKWKFITIFLHQQTSELIAAQQLFNIPDVWNVHVNYVLTDNTPFITPNPNGSSKLSC